ncbi:hypothetical protein [Streptomyces sp. NPDC001530]|uniref:hypothetical protein n=1 Tax=Streptomyces sp. NPDC001530 TaxID=3364582 RepID=UPI0036B790F0
MSHKGPRALDEGEHVSGPSAQEYRRRIRKAAAVFAGRVVNQADNAQRLLASKHPDIHHGLGMTCVWRYETAGCREELIVESGLRRDVVYPQHQDLVDEFRLRAKAQERVPTAAQELAERYAAVVEELKETKQQLAAEQQLTAFLRRTTVEPSIEVENLRREQEDATDATVVRMPRPRGPGRRFSTTDPGS